MNVKGLGVVKTCVAVVLCMLVVMPSLGFAEREETRQKQQREMQQMMDMLKNSGMDPKQLQQMQDMFKGMEGKGKKKRPQRLSAKLKKEQQKFAAETKGHGSATVDVKGKLYELTMTKCELTDRNSGHFSMEASQAPGNENAKLLVRGGGGHSGNAIQFTGKKIFYQVPGYPTFRLIGKTMEWEGTVKGNKGKVPLKFRLTCGAEMKDYAVASKPKPKSAANVVTFQLGKETHTFQAGRCSTEEYRTGNLMVEFEATATGKFRGRPAILLMTKSYPHGSVAAKRVFQNIDLLLGELTAEERVLSPLQVAELLGKKIGDFATKQNAAIKKKYDPKIAAFQENFDKEMPALKKQYGEQIPQDKMAALMDPFNQLLDAQGKESSQVSKQVKAKRYPTARSNGAFTVTGQDVHYGGSPLRTQDGQRAKEFQNLTADPELWVTCGE